MRGPHHDYEENCLKIQLRNTSILAETKMEIMQCAVAKCPKVCISTHGIQIPSLLDSGSHTLTNIYCQKLNRQQVRKPMLTVYSN